MPRLDRPYNVEDRYLKGSDFSRLCEALLFDGAGKGGNFLAYLADVGLLVPRWTIDLSDDVVRRLEAEKHPYFLSECHSISSDFAICKAAWDLFEDIENWKNPIFDDWLTPHPLDSSPGLRSPFVTSNYCQSRQVVIGISGNRKRLVSSTTHYYASWQVFQMAYLSGGFSRVIFDPTKFDASLGNDGSLRPFSSASPRALTKFQNISRVREISERQHFFDCVAAFRARSNRERARWEFAPAGSQVPPEKWHQCYIREIQIAKQEAARRQLSSDDLVEFIKWLAEVWDCASRETQVSLESETKALILRAGYMWRLLSARTWDDLVEAVGKVTSHFELTLRVIFPNWQDQQREAIERSFGASVRRMSNNKEFSELFSATPEKLPAALAQWMDEHGLNAFYWIQKSLSDARFNRDLDFDSGHRFSLQAFALFFEQFVRSFPINMGKHLGFIDVLDALWDGTLVLKGVPNKTNLTAALDLVQGLAAIDDAGVQHRLSPITVSMLKIVVIRHLAAHRGLPALESHLYFPLVSMMYDALVLCWAQAVRRGWASV